jgi:hypothetical protein
MTCPIAIALSEPRQRLPDRIDRRADRLAQDLH